MNPFLVHQFLERSAARFPDKVALVDGERRMTYREVNERANRLSRALTERGVRRGDRVAVHFEKSAEEALAIFAAAKAGAVFVVLNAALRAPQISYVLGDCAVKAVVTSSARWKALEDGVPSGAGAPLVLFADEKGAYSRDRRDPQTEVLGEDLAAIVYTSGSTGKPKGVMLTHQNLVVGSESVSSYLGITARDSILSLLPFSFDYGLNQLLTAFAAGGTVVLKKFLFPADALELARREKITGLAGIPTILIPLIQAASELGGRFPRLRYVTNSGGRLPVPWVRSFDRAFPETKLYLMYGLTEAFRSTYLDPSELGRRPDSIGKAVPHAEILVLGPDGRECAPGEVGELVHRGPLVSKGYWGRPEETAQKIRQNPLHRDFHDPVCFSGDFVKKDEEGFLYFIGRRDGMIKCAGYRISPGDIEEALFRNEAVREAAVVGIGDDTLGQKIMAVVVLKKGSRLSEAELLAHCARELPSYMTPQILRVVEALPKTPNGKPDRAALALGA